MARNFIFDMSGFSLDAKSDLRLAVCQALSPYQLSSRSDLLVTLSRHLQQLAFLVLFEEKRRCALHGVKNLQVKPALYPIAKEGKRPPSKTRTTAIATCAYSRELLFPSNLCCFAYYYI